MPRKVRLKLHPSEVAVIRSAAEIFSAYLRAGYIKNGEEEKWIDKSLDTAIQIARRAESRITSDDELN